MPTYGVTANGFVRKTQAQIQLEIEASLQASFGNYINVLPQSVFGQIVGIFSAREDALWGVAQNSYDASYPDTAFGTSLDNVVALNGVSRLPATYTTVKNVNMTGTANATIPAGKQAETQGTGYIFALDQDVTFDGSGNGVGNFTATTTGPLQAPAGQLTIIATPTAGWTTVSNPTDGVPGTNVETDDALRVRRLSELENSVSGPLEAIKKALLEVSGVSQVVMFENDTNVTDLNGLPPHSFEAYVFGGTDQDIYDAIWLAKPAGIQAFGTTCGTIIDSQLQTQHLCFSRLVQENVYGIANVHVSSAYPANGDTLIKEAVVNFINSLIGGQSLIVTPQLVCTVDLIPGILSISFLVGLTNPPTSGNNINPAVNQILRSDTSLWTVNHV